MPLTDDGLMQVPGILSRRVRLASGARAHYVTAGETGPAIVLLHGGLAGSSGMAGWRLMLPFLAENGFRVFAPDRPGFGHADTRPEYWPSLGWQSYAEFVAQFADALCLDEFFIGGNSQGAQNALYFMLNHPTRVKAAALIATASLARMVGVDDASLKPASFKYPPFEGSKESMQAMMASVVHRREAVSDELLEMRTLAANAQRESLAAAQAAFASKDPNLRQWQAVEERWNRLTTPTIYLQGRQDASVHIDNVVLAEQLLPNVQFFYVDECGHQGQSDQPDLFNRVFLEFFRDGKVSRETAISAGVSANRTELSVVGG